MVDGYVKKCLHEDLNCARDALVWKLEGLGEYDIRGLWTPTGTNLLGLVKHAATWEARYSDEVFRRPFADVPRWQAADGTDLWASADETRAQILDFHRRAREHADTTIRELPIEATGEVPWWPLPDVTLFAVLVHVFSDTTRHAGHADILREVLDGQTGVGPGDHQPIDVGVRPAHRDQIEAAARAASAPIRQRPPRHETTGPLDGSLKPACAMSRQAHWIFPASGLR